MTTVHTPGPWHVEPVTLGSIESGDGVTVAQAMMVRPFRDDPKSLERIANARLIAAAPELLAALIRLLDDGDEFLELQGRRNLARAAIAKATGA